MVSSYLVQLLLLSQPLPISLCYNSQEFSLLGFLLFNEVFGLQGLLSQLLQLSLTTSERYRLISLCNITNQVGRAQIEMDSVLLILPCDVSFSMV